MSVYVYIDCNFLGNYTNHNGTLDKFLDNGAFLTKSLVSYDMESLLINWQVTVGCFGLYSDVSKV